MGKGMVGQIGLPIEAHNYYLRLIVDSGIAGLFIFIAFLISLYLFLNKSIISEYLTLKYYLILLATSALAQDSFISQKPFALFITMMILVAVDSRQKRVYE